MKLEKGEEKREKESGARKREKETGEREISVKYITCDIVSYCIKCESSAESEEFDSRTRVHRDVSSVFRPGYPTPAGAYARNRRIRDWTRGSDAREDLFSPSPSAV